MDRFLFDPDQATAARDHAIDRVEAAADDRWKQEAHLAIRKIGRLSETFTTDDVWAAMPADVRAEVEPRAMGAIMRQAASEGVCVALGQWKPSTRVACHRRPLRVWRSLING